ncbi:probable peptidoglycan muropeptide transporter SLC46 [Halyomorpha halys]|uniref:probable peptidoglycan muropeptide transporter SLC46 n=1 Tax=Halyomorpha halys TaxID=286706 RepID=UPI0006D4F0D4|nr:uncharacterized protein LOC106693027 [Halyomorpha halys]
MNPTVQLICLFGSVFVYCFAIGIYGAIIPNFIQQKFCSPDVVPELDKICNDNVTLVEATDLVTTRGVIREAIPVFLLLLAGSWRDATGLNKPLFYCALAGEIVGVFVQLLAAWKWSISIWTVTIAEAVLYGVSGGSKLFYVAATCAVTDQSSDNQRTSRMMFYQVAAYAGTCLSSGLSGYSLHLLGYTWFFITVIALHVLTIVLVVLSKEAENRLKKDEKAKIFQKMKAITRSRPNNLVVWLMLISCVIINVCAGAETNLYLYYLQLMFDFTVKEAGLYSAFRLMFGVGSTMVLSPVFTRVLKWSDFRIGILSSFMTFIATTAMIFARTLVHLIIFALLDFLKIFVYTLPMSIVTKCVKSDEVGIFVSLRFIGGCLSPTFVYYIYNEIFSATSQKMPGAFFIASSGITLLVFLCFWISSCIYKEPADVSENNPTINTDSEKRESAEISEDNGFIEKPLAKA